MRLLIDSVKLLAFLDQKGMSETDLASRLETEMRPSHRLINDWLRGSKTPVRQRWRRALSEHFSSSEDKMFDERGILKPEVTGWPNWTPENLFSVRSKVSVSKAAIHEWKKTTSIVAGKQMKSRTGISEQHLDAIAALLGCRPVDLVSPDVINWMTEFLKGGPATNDDI